MCADFSSQFRKFLFIGFLGDWVINLSCHLSLPGYVPALEPTRQCGGGAVGDGERRCTLQELGAMRSEGLDTFLKVHRLAQCLRI